MTSSLAVARRARTRDFVMAKALAAVGFVLALLSMGAAHGINLALIWAGMLCCGFAALHGYKFSTLGTVAVAATGLLVFSPLTLAAIFGNAARGDWTLAVLAIVPLLLPLAAMLFAGKRPGGAGLRRAPE
jgi:hypothetical protein